MKKIKFLYWLLVFFFIFSSFSGSVFAKVKKSSDTVSPTVPTNLSATVISDYYITLSWTASTDNVGVKSYSIYMNNKLKTQTTSTNCTIKNLSKNTSYTFTIRAADSSGNYSDYSAKLSVRTLGGAVIEPTASPTPTVTPAPTPTPTATPIPTPVTEPSKYVVGYYASWSAYSGYTPDKIKESDLTHVNYAFANIGTDYKVTLGDSYIDLINFEKLKQLKNENPSLKTLISVGGWNWSGRFSDVALTETSRELFSQSLVAFIKTYGFDGVDLDWEYPVSGGMAGNVKRPEDKQNFTLLLKTIREKLDEQGSLDGKHYLFSIAGAAGSWYCNNVELNLISQYLDYAIVMTYDLHGTWDQYTDFNAPLFNPLESSPQYKWSVDSSIKAWIAGGFPENKIVMGIPFYGYAYQSVTNNNNGLYSMFSSGSSLTYDSVRSTYLTDSSYKRYFHYDAKVPWLWNGSTFVTYDNEQSITYKATYIKEKSLAGAAVWHLGGDTSGTLLNSLNLSIK